jgi:hypothetical protein
MPFLFHPSSLFFHLLNLIIILFNAIFIWNNFLNWFCFTIHPLSFFLSNLIFIFFIVNFFSLTSFLNWFVINFLIELGFKVSRVASFKDFTRFMMFPEFAWFFYFTLSKLIVFLISSFNIYWIGDWVTYCFSFLSAQVFVGFENDLIIMSLLFIILYWVFLANSLNWYPFPISSLHIWNYFLNNL